MIILYLRVLQLFLFFFFNDTATTEIYTLSLHDALPICAGDVAPGAHDSRDAGDSNLPVDRLGEDAERHACCCWSSCWQRSEEHTSELQSQSNLVCRLLLEKKKNI